MKSLFIFSLLLFGIFSCKKDDKKLTTTSTSIRYTIQPIDSNIIDVRFNNASGTQVTQSGFGDFTDGSKTIIVNSKPFPAKVGITFQDLPFSVDVYELSIFVNGTLKARDTISNSGQSDIGEGYLEYTVE